jgi:hypothetical protein
MWWYRRMAPLTPDPGAGSPTTEALARRVALRLGRTVAAVHAVTGGYSLAQRFVIRWLGGGSVFVKGATDADTALWLRSEYTIYARGRARFLPELLGWEDDGAAPWLALEDLSAASWPPPWSSSRIDAVLATMAEVAACPASDLPSMETRRTDFAGWPRVAAEPEAFLRLGLATDRWLSRALPTLLDAEGRAVLDGDALLHNDVRSDNLCFADERVVLVDWNWACRGNSKLDIAAWLPSLALEGGPAPEVILPEEGNLACFVAGFYAAHAGLPPLSGRPTLRALQLAMLRQSLAWATRALGLPAPDGPISGAGGINRQEPGIAR